MLILPVFLVLLIVLGELDMTTQLERVSGNNTNRNLLFIAIFYVTSILILLLTVFNANSFLPAMVSMRATDA
jgi:hypothetical protein